MLSPARGKITHVLLTRAPLYWGRSPFSCDLHVLGAPLTFVLSQDQTLQLNLSSPLAACPLREGKLGLWLLEMWSVASAAARSIWPGATSRAPGTHSSLSRVQPKRHAKR